MRSAPEIISGMRVRNQTSRPAEVSAGLFARISAFMADRGAPKVKKPKTPYEVVFESRFSRHRIQIDAPEAGIDSRGRKIVERPLVAQFSQGHFSIPRWVKPQQAEYMLECLRAHPAIKSREVWEQTDLTQAILTTKVASIIDTMKKDPDLHKTVMEFLETEDYTDETTAPADEVEEVEEEIAAAEEEIEEPVAEEVLSQVRRKSGRRPKSRRGVIRARA